MFNRNSGHKCVGTAKPTQCLSFSFLLQLYSRPLELNELLAQNFQFVFDLFECRPLRQTLTYSMCVSVLCMCWIRVCAALLTKLAFTFLSAIRSYSLAFIWIEKFSFFLMNR